MSRFPPGGAIGSKFPPAWRTRPGAASGHTDASCLEYNSTIRRLQYCDGVRVASGTLGFESKRFQNCDDGVIELVPLHQLEGLRQELRHSIREGLRRLDRKSVV